MDLGLKVRPLSFVSRDPGNDICEVADVKSADIVLLGWHKPVVGGAMLTGVVPRVMVDAPCDVGVLVDRGLTEICRVLVPYRGTDHDRAALRLAKRIAENNGAEVTILHVVPEPAEAGGASKTDSTEAMVREELSDGEDGRRFKVVFKAVAHTDPGQAAIDESQSGYDMLVVGLGRHWGLEHRSFGARAEAILARAPTSILVVRSGTPPTAIKRPRSEEHRARFATVA
jgi:nucleotide-binding universal stress UspA family protein